MKTKARKVLDLLNGSPTMTDAQIATKVNCHRTYVAYLRKRMVHRDDTLDLTPDMEVHQEARDIQEGGDHYKRLGVEPWDVFDTWPVEQRIGAYRANCTKYIMRLDAKDTPLINAKKLRHYATKLVEVLEQAR